MRLRELQQTANLRTLAVTSALPQDGKSTVAMNLATALAERGDRRVLLVEADLHHPTIARDLKITCRAGLGECLETGQAPLSSVSRLEPLGWYLLQGGSVAGNPTDLLHTERFSDIVRQLSSHFDWVLFDTPPVAPLTDALSVSKQCDATLVVVRAHRTPSSAVDEALELLGPKKVAGIIFNGAEGLNRLYYKYSSYYQRQ